MNPQDKNPAEGKGSFWLTLPGILMGVAAVITAIGGLYATGLIGRSSIQTELTDEEVKPPPATDTNWLVRLSNIDDHGFVYLNGGRVLECHVREPLCEAEIGHLLRSGANDLRFELINDRWGWTYRLQILKDGEVWHEDECGEQGVEGCRGDDQTTGTVFETSFEIAR